MITKYYIECQPDGEVYCGVETDDGGDKDWGPYPSRAAALVRLRSMVIDAYDEDYDESKLEEREWKGEGET